MHLGINRKAPDVICASRFGTWSGPNTILVCPIYFLKETTSKKQKQSWETLKISGGTWSEISDWDLIEKISWPKTVSVKKKKKKATLQEGIFGTLYFNTKLRKNVKTCIVKQNKWHGDYRKRHWQTCLLATGPLTEGNVLCRIRRGRLLVGWVGWFHAGG